MSKKKIACLPDARKPPTGANIATWNNAGPIAYTDKALTHVSGTVSTINSTQYSENTNGERAGDPYSSTGFSCNVKTKSSSEFYTTTYVGATDGLLNSSGNVNGALLKDGKFSDSLKSAYIPNVVGFYCQVSSAPIGNDSSVDDGCGRVSAIRITAVYADEYQKAHVMDLCQNASQYSDHRWNSNPGHSWTEMCYSVYLGSALHDIIEKGWLFMGWNINMTHVKTCGGGSKQKNCTGRVRYLTPLVSSSDDAGVEDEGAPLRWQVLSPPNLTWPNRYGQTGSIPSGRSNRWKIQTI